MALAAKYYLKLHQSDITSVFLNGELKEDIYIKQPEEFMMKGKEHHVCKLKRSLYGLKQSPRCWNDCQMKKMGLKQLKNDPCIYTLSSEVEMFIVAVYVDDFIVESKSSTCVHKFLKNLSENFNIEDIVKVHYFFGVKVVYPESGKIIFVNAHT